MAQENVGIQHWRFYDNDNSDVNSCSTRGAEDSTAEEAILDAPFIVRMSIWNDNSANYSAQNQLQARVDGGSWFNVTGSSSNVRVATGQPTDGDACSTQLLTSHGSYSWENDGKYDDGDGATASTTHTKQTFWEDAWCVVCRSAELSGGELIEFRIDNTGGTETDPGTFPQLDAITAPSYTGTGSGTATPATQTAGTGVYGYPAGDGSGTLAVATQTAGTGTYALEYTGNGAGTLQPATGAGTGTYAPLLKMALSDYIGASGEDTTEQLTGPGGGATFAAGRIQDDENPADNVSAHTTGWVEFEWTVQSSEADDYEFRVVVGGTPVTSDVTPELTVQTTGDVGDGDGTLTPVTCSATGTYSDPVYSDGAGDGTLVPATCSATGTYADPAYSGDGSGSLLPATGAADGTYTDPTYSDGAGDGTLAPATCSGTGTYADPQYSDGAGDGTLQVVEQTAGLGVTGYPAGDGSGTLQPVTCSATGSYVEASYSGDGSGTCEPVAQTAGTGTYSDATYSGDGDATLQVVTGSATGTFITEEYPGDGSGTLQPVTGSGTGTYADPAYSGDGAGTLQVVTCAATGTFADPTYGDGAGDATLVPATSSATGVYGYPSGDGSGTLAPATGTGTGVFSVETYTGNGAGTLQPVTGSATGTYSDATYSGNGDATFQPATQTAGTGTHTDPTYTGNGDATLVTVTCQATGTFIVEEYPGDGSGTLEVVTQTAGTATYSDPSYTGQADATLPPVTCQATGTFSVPTYSGAGAGTLPTTTGAGSGSYADALFQGDGSGTLQPVQGAGTGTYIAPVTGDGDGTLDIVTGTATGLYADPAYTGTGAGVPQPVTGTGTGTWADPAYSGDGDGALVPVAGTATGLFYDIGTKYGDGDGTLAAVTGQGHGVYTLPLDTHYQEVHTSTVTLLEEKGAAATFTQTAVLYDSDEDQTLTFTRTFPGKAIRVKGTPRQYEAMGMVATEGPVLLWAPSTMGNLPPLGSKVTWAGSQYTLAGILPTAPDGPAIMARMFLSDGVGTEEAQTGAKYTDQHSSAAKIVQEKGKAVTFTETTVTYDEEEDQVAATASIITGYALRTRGKREVYEELGLIENRAPTLLFVPDTYGDIPAAGATVEWEEVVRTVRWVEPVAPDGTSILNRVVVE